MEAVEIAVLPCPNCDGRIVALVSGLVIWHAHPHCGVKPTPCYRSRTGDYGHSKHTKDRA